MGAGTARAGGAERVLAALVEQREELIDAYAQAVSGGRDPARLGDVREAAEEAIDILLAAMQAGRSLTPDDAGFARVYFRHAMLRGATEAELLASCRQSMRVMWEALNRLAGTKPAGRAIVAELSGPLIEYVEVLSAVAADTYQEVQSALSSSRRNVSRQAVEDLLDGRVLEAGASIDAVRRSGLAEDSPLVVLSAASAAPPAEHAELMVAAASLARAGADPVEPLFAVRSEEIVVVRAIRDEPSSYVDGLDAAASRLRRDGIRLLIGVSAVHTGVRSVPLAYQEAWLARERSAGSAGVIALATMNPLDYLLMRAGDETALRLVPERIRQFIENDMDQAGLLVQTLIAFFEADLNTKLAAERLFVHPNTAHYRLTKIAEATGCDLRSPADIIQLVVAVRLAQAASAGPAV